MTSRFCPTCGRVDVSVTSDEGPLPGMTGEFMVPADLAAAGAAGAATAQSPTPMPYAGSDQCSWCGKREGQVKKLITGPGVQICNECVDFCSLILRDELGR
jgi:hypothetical protein